MTSFSASEAAVSGFRFIRRHPRTILAWAGVLFTWEVVYGLLLVGLARDQLPAVEALGRPNETDPEAALQMVPAVSPVLLLTLLGLWAIASVMFSAAYRDQFEPENSRWGHVPSVGTSSGSPR